MQDKNIIAYIDGANLHKGIMELGWKLDYRRFRVWLKDKYKVERAYIFLGLVSKQKDLYTFLQEAGFTMVFKETSVDGEGKVKGNCDADLVLKAACDFYEGFLKQAVLVSSDGDYASLVAFWKEKRVFRTLISPNNKCSFLLRKQNVQIIYLDTQKNSLMYSRPNKEKAPGRDETLQGSFS